MGKIFVTSDLHFGHDREFVWKVRGFNSVMEMNEEYVKHWNRLVTNEDDVYVLGDLMLGNNNIGVHYLNQLNGNIHVVLGNHDTPTRQALYKADVHKIVEVKWAIMLNYKKYHFFMTHFPCMTGNLEKESLKQMTLNLYGHTHQKTNFYEDRPYMYHVGVDSHDGYPVLLDDIIQEMKDKVKECIDFLDEELTVVDNPSVEAVEPRCHKCVFDINTCGSSDYFGGCKIYTRDPPDGGFYG